MWQNNEWKNLLTSTNKTKKNYCWILGVRAPMLMPCEASIVQFAWVGAILHQACPFMLWLMLLMIVWGNNIKDDHEIDYLHWRGQRHGFLPWYKVLVILGLLLPNQTAWEEAGVQRKVSLWGKSGLLKCRSKQCKHLAVWVRWKALLLTDLIEKRNIYHQGYTLRHSRVLSCKLIRMSCFILHF